MRFKKPQRMAIPIAIVLDIQAQLLQPQAPGVFVRPADPQAGCSAAPLHPVLLDDHGFRRLSQAKRRYVGQFANEPPGLQEGFPRGALHYPSTFRRISKK